MIGVGTIAIIFFLKVDRLKGGIFAKIRKFDWFGSTIFIASTVSFLIPVTWGMFLLINSPDTFLTILIGGVMFAWDSWRTLVPLLVGTAGIAVFGFYEYRLSAKAFDPEGELLPGNNVQPMIPFSIFNNWTLRLIYLQTLVHGMILWSLLYFLPLYYEGVKGYTPIITGVAVLPETLLMARKFHPICT